MKALGAFEAKTHFSQLLNEVIKGQSFLITKHGEKIAMLVPFDVQKKPNVVADAIQTLKTLRKGVTLGKKLSIKILKEEGRK